MPGDVAVAAVAAEAVPLRDPDDLDAIVARCARASVVMLGEATHGTSEFYRRRALLSRRLIEEHGFDFIAVEGDWPDAHTIDRYIRGVGDDADAHATLRRFDRWPTWMWANSEVAELVESLREHNAGRPHGRQVGFYGLDVYSLFESIHAVVEYLATVDPALAALARERYACFGAFRGDEIAYARAALVLGDDCAAAAVAMLSDLLAIRLNGRDDDLLDARQNARVVYNAERYYRTMIHGNVRSWNVRDRHMLETLDQLVRRRDGRGGRGRGIVWAHNTHVGDYRATEMARFGQLNLGGLARDHFGHDNVALIGLTTYSGGVIAARAWDAPHETMRVPAARGDSHDALLHELTRSGVGHPDFALALDTPAAHALFSRVRGQRAIGVVYDPALDALRNYVATDLRSRYDAVIHFDQSTPVTPLGVPFARDQLPEAFPSGV